MPWGNAPICRRCWIDQNRNRDPVCVLGSPEEECVFCEGWTNDGIYVRVELCGKPVFDNPCHLRKDHPGGCGTVIINPPTCGKLLDGLPCVLDVEHVRGCMTMVDPNG